VTLKPGLGSFKVIEKYTIQSGTYDFRVEVPDFQVEEYAFYELSRV